MAKLENSIAKAPKQEPLPQLRFFTYMYVDFQRFCIQNWHQIMSVISRNRPLKSNLKSFTWANSGVYTWTHTQAAPEAAVWHGQERGWVPKNNRPSLRQMLRTGMHLQYLRHPTHFQMFEESAAKKNATPHHSVRLLSVVETTWNSANIAGRRFQKSCNCLQVQFNSLECATPFCPEAVEFTGRPLEVHRQYRVGQHPPMSDMPL